MTMPAPPPMLPMAQIRCEVGTLVSLGAAPLGERRYVPLGGGTVRGPELNGTLVAGGVDWQLARGEAVPRDADFFRTLVRFTTGAPQWQHLNQVMAVSVGQREARVVVLDLYRLS